MLCCIYPALSFPTSSSAHLLTDGPDAGHSHTNLSKKMCRKKNPRGSVKKPRFQKEFIFKMKCFKKNPLSFKPSFIWFCSIDNLLKWEKSFLFLHMWKKGLKETLSFTFICPFSHFLWSQRPFSIRFKQLLIGKIKTKFQCLHWKNILHQIKPVKKVEND